MWSSTDKSLLSKSLTIPILVKSSFDSEFARTVVGMTKLKKAVIDDIAFQFFAMHCGIGRGIRQRNSHKNDYVVNITN